MAPRHPRAPGALLLLAVLALLVSGSLAPAGAGAAVLLPPGNAFFTGLTGGSYPTFEREVGKHAAVNGVFVTWGRSLQQAFGEARYNHARLMLHLSTAQGYGAPEQITPRAVAEGSGDRYLLSMSEQVARGAEPVYVRLFPEMNQANNAYCAFNADGSSRGASHSPASFRQAWRRVVLVLRGGPVSAIDARLHALGMPPLRGTSAADLPLLPVSFLWVPQTAGSPDIQANAPGSYYPGSAYVDWVGTDFYSRYPNFSGLQRFYGEYPGKPFAFGEWALWDEDNSPWVSRLFSFIGSHPRVRMALYNEGERTNGPFRLSRFPSSRGELQHLLAAPRFLAYTPEWRGR